MLDLKLIHHAIALAQYRNFARTAEQLGISQPTLSRNIANLEAALGVRLFDRGQDGVSATDFGKLLISQGQDLVKSAHELEREIKLLQGLDVGELLIGVGPYPLEISMGPSLARLMTKYPGLRVEVDASDLHTLPNDVLEGRLDLGVLELTLAECEPKLQTERLPSHRGVFYCRGGHPLAGKRQPDIADIFAFPYVGTRLPPRLAQSFQHIIPAGNIDKATGDFMPPVTTSALRIAREIVLHSDAISIGIRSQIAGELADGRLAVIDFHPPWLVTNYGFVYLRNRSLSPAAMAFMEEMRAVEAEISATDSQEN
jgi:DNA-binding transcriptional LysR family regulator